ncbi:MAG: hypothetical protein OEU95_09925 [Nitrospirota bacterium]|nr:hypothetical protein [Nitrospirota bacterium]
MKTLNRKEILAELRKLGIQTFSELRSYLRDYNEYCERCNLNENDRPALLCNRDS